MTDQGTKVINELIHDLEESGRFDVVNVGARYRVTNKDGGEPVFLPARLPRGGRVADLLRNLQSIGWTEELAEKVRDQERRERLAADKERGERMMAAAQVQAARAAEAMSVAPPEDRPEPRTEIMVITPDFAAELLRANRFYMPDSPQWGANRNFSPDLARRYAAAMLRGEWVATHQGIALDTEGGLVDGQHRLAAVVLAGEKDPTIKVSMQVTYDLDPHVRWKVDLGRKRTMSDFLSMSGLTQAYLLSGVVRLVYLYDNVSWDAQEWRRTYPSPDEVLSILEKHPELIASAKLGSTIRAGLPGAMGAGLYVCSRAWKGAESEITDFVAGLRTGAVPEVGDVRLTLRDTLLKQKGNRKYKRSAYEQMALLIKAWNLWVLRESRTLLVWRSSVEPFPCPVERNA